MADRRAHPPIFDIGFPDAGGAWLARLFEANGLPARLRLGGKLAEDIAVAQATGGVPLGRWPRARLFAELEDTPAPPNPPVEAFRLFAFLDRAFPGAAFVLPSRDLDDWIARRFERGHGLDREKDALRLGVTEADLPEIWRADWAAHVAAVETHFGADPRLIRFDIDRDRPEDLAAALAPWVRLEELPAPRPWDTPGARGLTRGMMRARLASPEARRGPGPADEGLAEQIARHCLGRLAPGPGAWPRPERSHVYGAWDGAARVLDRRDEPLPLLRVGDAFLRAAERPKLERIQGALAEMAALGARGPVTLDMEDARPAGMPGRAVPPRPIVTYNRRAGVANLVLWPLVGYHSPGGRFYVSAQDRDPHAFADKADRLVWRGNLTGRSAPGSGPGGDWGRPAREIYPEIAAAREGSAQRAARIAELLSIPRVAAVRRWSGRPGYDLALTPGAQHGMARELAETAPLVGDTRPPGWFYRARYLLSMSGNDTGSNFLMAANSNALVLKEEDGWELFYTGLYRPWEHYLPLVPGLDDLDEKLAWARAHPAEAAAMAQAARAMSKRLAEPATRRLALTLVLEGLNAL